ncbi:MAG: hypothetical protein ACRCSK_03405 [Fusobacteriaceae bacterium]
MNEKVFKVYHVKDSFFTLMDKVVPNNNLMKNKDGKNSRPSVVTIQD